MPLASNQRLVSGFQIGFVMSGISKSDTLFAGMSGWLVRFIGLMRFLAVFLFALFPLPFALRSFTASLALRDGGMLG